MAEDETKGNPFDPESAVETFEVGGQKLVVKPLKVKQFRALVAAITNATNAVADSAKKVGEMSNVSNLVDDVFAHSFEVFRVVFPEGEFSFLTKDFIDDNFTVPMMQRLFQRIIAINNLGSIFPNLASSLGAAPSAPKIG